MEKYKLRNIILYTSALCNLKCSYCYIAKNKYLNIVDRELKESFNGNYYLDFIDKLSDVFDTSHIEYIDMWGAEPTLGFKDVADTIKNISTKYKTIKGFYSSSNFSSPVILQNILYLLSKLDDRNYTYKQQISIDGPKYINDANRGVGTADGIIYNINSLLENYKEIPNNIELSLSFKPTLTIDQIYGMLSKDKIIEYFKFFEDELILPIREKLNIHIGYPGITLVAPGMYTQEDGRMFKEFCTICKKIDSEKHLKFSKATPYHFRSTKPWDKFDEDIYNLGYGFCGPGISNIGLLPGYNLCLCHRTFTSICEQYNNQASEYVSPFSNPKLYEANKRFHTFCFNIDNAELMLNNFRIYKDRKNTTILSSMSSLIMLLAHSGQILEKYKTQHNALLASKAVLSVFGYCPKDSIDVVGTISSTFTSPLKILLNGALDVICEGSVYEF